MQCFAIGGILSFKYIDGAEKEPDIPLDLAAMACACPWFLSSEPFQRAGLCGDVAFSKEESVRKGFFVALTNQVCVDCGTRHGRHSSILVSCPVRLGGMHVYGQSVLCTGMTGAKCFSNELSVLSRFIEPFLQSLVFSRAAVAPLANERLSLETAREVASPPFPASWSKYSWGSFSFGASRLFWRAHCRGHRGTNAGDTRPRVKFLDPTISGDPSVDMLLRGSCCGIYAFGAGRINQRCDPAPYRRLVSKCLGDLAAIPDRAPLQSTTVLAR